MEKFIIDEGSDLLKSSKTERKWKINNFTCRKSFAGDYVGKRLSKSNLCNAGDQKVCLLSAAFCAAFCEIYSSKMDNRQGLRFERSCDFHVQDFLPPS